MEKGEAPEGLDDVEEVLMVRGGIAPVEVGVVMGTLSAVAFVGVIGCIVDSLATAVDGGGISCGVAGGGVGDDGTEDPAVAVPITLA